MHAGHAHNRGFSLVEVAIVTIVVGVLAASVVPAISQLDSARRAAAADEVARMLVVARSTGTTTGEATGVEISPSDNSAALVRVARDGSGVGPAIDPMGQPHERLDIAGLFAGASVDSFVNGDGSSGDGVVWFGFDGTPQTRDADGSNPFPFAEDAVVSFVGGQTVIVRQHSGLVE